MGKVVDIEEGMAHCVVVGPMNEPHVVPLSVIERLGNGSLPLIINESQREADEDLIRGIISDWLRVRSR